MGIKLKYLEGIRGFAALIVVLRHIFVIFYPTLTFGDISNAHTRYPNIEHALFVSPLSIFYGGNFAVCIFFVLSGFVLSYKYFNTNDQTILAEYSAKRYFRLLIPVLFLMICTGIYLFTSRHDFVNMSLITRSGWLPYVYKVQPTIPLMLKNCFIDVFFTGSDEFGPVLWTMSIELYGSLLLFAVLSVSHHIKRKDWLLYSLIAILIVLKAYYYIAFFAGALFCIQYISAFKSGRLYNKPITLGLFILGICFASYPDSTFANAWGYAHDSIYRILTFENHRNLTLPYHVAGAILLMAAAVRSKLAINFFSNKIFSFLGKISFSIYLIHVLLLSVITAPLFMYFQQMMSYNRAVLASVSLSVPILFIAAWFMHLYVDKPAVKISNTIGKFIIKKLNSSAERPA